MLLKLVLALLAPLYCQYNVVVHMQTAWAMSLDGFSEAEAGFVVNGTEPQPVILGDVGKVTLAIIPGVTTAIFHTHPHREWQPSAADIAVADKFKLDMYVMTARGLTLYRPPALAGEHGTTWIVRPNLEWLMFCQDVTAVPVTLN
jgi:hypothetical protein